MIFRGRGFDPAWWLKESLLTLGTFLAVIGILGFVALCGIPSALKRQWIIMRVYRGDRQAYLNDTWELAVEKRKGKAS